MTSMAPHGCVQHDHKLHGSGRADSEGDINLGEGRAFLVGGPERRGTGRIGGG